MKPGKHINKAIKVLDGMVTHGHLMHENNFEFSNCITSAQVFLQEAKRIAAEAERKKNET